MVVEDGGAVDEEVHAVVVDDDDAGVEEVVSVKIPISLGRRVSARTISARESFARAAKFADLS